MRRVAWESLQDFPDLTIGLFAQDSRLLKLTLERISRQAGYYRPAAD